MEFLGFNKKGLNAIDSAKIKIMELFNSKDKVLSFDAILKITDMAQNSGRTAIKCLIDAKNLKKVKSGKVVTYSKVI